MYITKSFPFPILYSSLNGTSISSFCTKLVISLFEISLPSTSTLRLYLVNSIFSPFVAILVPTSNCPSTINFSPFKPALSGFIFPLIVGKYSVHIYNIECSSRYSVLVSPLAFKVIKGNISSFSKIFTGRTALYCPLFSFIIWVVFSPRVIFTVISVITVFGTIKNLTFAFLVSASKSRNSCVALVNKLACLFNCSSTL